MPESRADGESDQDQGRKFDFGTLLIEPVAVNDIPEVRDSGLLVSHTLLRYAGSPLTWRPTLMSSPANIARQR